MHLTMDRQRSAAALPAELDELESNKLLILSAACRVGRGDVWGAGCPLSFPTKGFLCLRCPRTKCFSPCVGR